MYKKSLFLFLLIVSFTYCIGQSDDKWLKANFDTLKIEGTYRIDTIYDCFVVMKIYKNKQKYSYEIIASEYYKTGDLFVVKDDDFFCFKLVFDSLSHSYPQNLCFHPQRNGKGCWAIRFRNHLIDGKIIKECNNMGYGSLDFLKIN